MPGSSPDPSTSSLVVAPSAAPVVTLSGAALTYIAGDSAVIMDGAATVSDVDSFDLDGGVLSVRIASGSDPDDRLDLRSQGNGAGQISVSGSDISFEGTVVATYTGEVSDSNALEITLNASSTPAAAQAILRAVLYRNVEAANPTNAARVFAATLSDGDGATSTLVSRSVDVHDPISSLLAHYQFDEAPSASTALDSSGAGHNATLFAMTAANWFEGGMIGSFLRTVGASSQYLSTGVDLRAHSDFSFSLWIRPSAATASSTQTILWQGAAGQNGWGGGLSPTATANEMHLSLNYFNGCFTGLNFYLGSTDPVDPSTCAERSNALVRDAMPSTSAWTHVAVTVSGANTALATVELHVDGTLRSTQTSDELNRSSWLSSLVIGRPDAAARFYSGDLDHVRVYSKALSGSEIAVLAAEGRN